MADFCSWKVEHSRKGAIAGKKSIPDPPGYSSSVLSSELDTARAGKVVGLDDAAKNRKADALRQKALEPAKSAGFMCFMLWMSGNGLQLFSIMMLVSCIHGPIQAIANVAKVFPKDPNVDVLLPRLIFCAVQCGQLAFAGYKLHNMGLLPTYPSDWMSHMEPPSIVEASTGPVA